MRHRTDRHRRGVFRILDHRISAGEMKDVRQVLPPEIRELFD